MDLIIINGVVLPSPTAYDVELSDVDSPDSGRMETGVMNRDRVRGDVAKIQLGFTALSTKELTTIVTAIQPEEFAVTFFYGTVKTASMYSGNKQLSLKSVSGEDCTWNLSFNLVEF